MIVLVLVVLVPVSFPEDCSILDRFLLDSGAPREGQEAHGPPETFYCIFGLVVYPVCVRCDSICRGYIYGI